MKNELIKVFGLFIVVSLIFFYPILRGQIPFPGDLLVSIYEPYRAYPVLGYQPGAVPSKNQGVDVARHIFPWKNFAIESLKKNQIPFWDTHNFSGNLLMANFQSGVFYPFNIILILLPFLNGWTIYIISAPILSSFFMYLFLRELKLSKLSSFFAGILFAFCSFMVVWMEYGNLGHTFLWLPLALLWTEKFIKKSQYKYIIFLTLTLVMSLLAGFIQLYSYVVTTIFIYFLAKSYYNKSLTLKKFSVFSLGIIFSVFLSLFQLLPTIELFSYSSRGNYTLSQIQNLLNPWWYLVTTVVPNFFGNPASANHWFYGTYIERVSYIGIIPLVFASYAAFNFRKRKEIVIFGGIALFALFITTDFFITRYFHQIPIPVISTAVPTRMLSLFQFGAIVLFAIGVDLFRKGINRKSFYFSILIISVIVAVAWVFVFLGPKISGIDPINLATSKRNLVVPSILVLSLIIFAYLWARLKSNILLIVILFISVTDLFYFFNRITPFSPKEFVYPQTPVITFLKENAGINRFWGYGSGYVESDLQTFDKTYSPEGVDALHIADYSKLLVSSKDGRIPQVVPRMDANLVGGYGKDDLRNNQYRQRLLNVLGIKYVLHKYGSSMSDNATFSDVYKMVYSDGYYQVYENKKVLPRIFLASNYIVEKDKQKILDKIYDPSFDLRQNVILEENPAMKFQNDESSNVLLKSYEENKISVETSSKANMILFLSDTYYPGWQVRVDGKDAKIYKADFTFRAVPLALGKHEVVFSYAAQTFKTGFYLSVLAFLVFITTGFYFYKRNV